MFCAAVQAGEPEAIRPWGEYRTIMWMGDTVWKKPEKVALFFQRMREMGVNTGMIHHGGDPKPVIENKFPFYGENLVNKGLCLKFNSHVTDWEKFVTAWAKTRDEAGAVRDYCLDDPAWRQYADSEVQRIVKEEAPYAPLAYDIRDELSTTYSANPFDYDLSPIALASFRKWLQRSYSDLEALNAEWETSFKTWDEVKPFTTDQIKNRMGSGDAAPRGKPDWQAVQKIQFIPAEARKEPTRWNLAPWCDFRSYMDTSLASALDEMRTASHAIDPRTPVGIEGTQMPDAFGGYDYWKLCSSLDWIEPYDIGNAREIAGSFMPGKPILTTVGEPDARAAQRRLWHLLLEGDKGCLVWWSEDSIDWTSDDYQLTPRAKGLAPILKEMTAPLAGLFLAAVREYDPIAIQYSQPSIQVDWLLESTVDGSTWLRRFSSFEAANNRQVRVRDAWLKIFTDLGWSPKFVSSEQIEQGELGRGKYAVCVLPEALALTGKEAQELRAFAEGAGHFVFCDGIPGMFDGHGKLRAEPAPFTKLPSVRSQEQSFGLDGTAQSIAAGMGGDIAQYPAARAASAPDLAWAQWAARQLHGSVPPVRVPLESRTAVFRYRLGDARLLAFERNVDYQGSEDLKQKGGNEALEKSVKISATLAAAAHVYDLRTGKYLGLVDQFNFTVDPWMPSLFALTSAKLADGDIVAALRRR